MKVKFLIRYNRLVNGPARLLIKSVSRVVNYCAVSNISSLELGKWSQ